MTRPIGYVDKLSAAAGDAISLMLSSSESPVEVSFVRLRVAHKHRHDPIIAEDVPGERHFVGAALQPVVPGSYMIAPHGRGPAIADFTMCAWVWCRTPTSGGERGVIAKWDPTTSSGFALGLDAGGALTLWSGDGAARSSVSLSRPLRPRAWYFVFAAFDPWTHDAIVGQRCLDHWVGPAGEEERRAHLQDAHVDRADIPWVVGARGVRPAGDRETPCGCFSGKIEAPTVWRRAQSDVQQIASQADTIAFDDPELLVAWDFGSRFGSPQVIDRGPAGLHARVVNTPARGVTGHRWTGQNCDFQSAADQYAAIHFHADDLTDAAWPTAFTWSIPATLASGVYAARLITRAGEDFVPFVVRGAAAESSAPVRVLLPTFTYLAYANARSLGPESDPRREVGWAVPPAANDDLLADHPEYGLSLYDLHADGAEVVYSSLHRPLLTMRPDAWHRAIDAPRHFAADLCLIEWLDRAGFNADVITDGDLHAMGSDALADVDVLITGSHPEYCSGAMLDAVEAFVAHGGALMYLGGNGFESVASVAAHDPGTLEIRRGPSSGRRSPEPGEIYLSVSGEPGGLWRNRGRPPHRLVGVGTSAIGQDTRGRGYQRRPDSYRPEAEFVFAGIAPGEIIGAFGLAMNGAGGDELDRTDPDRGTPEDALVLATANGFSESYRVISFDQDEVGYMSGGTTHRSVRADMVLIPHPSGGAVFSVGSVSWIAALPINDYDNNVARLSGNVLRHFLAARPS